MSDEGQQTANEDHESHEHGGAAAGPELVHDAAGFDALLRYLNRSRGFDFGSYSLANHEEGEQTVECVNRRGKAIRCRVNVTPVMGSPHRGVTIVIEESSEP